MNDLLRALLNNKLLKDDFKPQINHQLKVFQPEEYILTSGTLYPFFCLINKGAVKIIISKSNHLPKSDHRAIITNLGDHDIFGEFGLFDQSPASADVVAITKVELIMIDKDSFLKFLESEPKLGYEVVVDMLQSVFKKIIHLNKTTYHLLKNS